jgi:hypothetical protein
MKNLLLILTFALSTPAFAVYAPNWERPVQGADMNVLQADGHFEGAEAVALTLNRRDGEKKAVATSFTLDLSVPSSEGLRAVRYVIPVSDVSMNDQGVVVIKGSLKLFNENAATGYFPAIAIEVVPQAGEWEARVRFTESGSVTSTSNLRLSGSPEAVMTIQSHLE